MIYLIGGPPRVGKTQLVHEVLQRKPMHAISTDAIRYMLRHSFDASKISNDLFLSRETNVTTQSIDTLLQRQSQESVALWPYLLSIMQSYDEDGYDLLVEGVAVLPHLAASLPFQNRSVFIGNTEASHADVVAKIAAGNDKDWLHTKSPEEVQAYNHFFIFMSRWFQEQAEEQGLPFVAIHDAGFELDLSQAAEILLS